MGGLRLVVGVSKVTYGGSLRLYVGSLRLHVGGGLRLNDICFM